MPVNAMPGVAVVILAGEVVVVRDVRVPVSAEEGVAAAVLPHAAILACVASCKPPSWRPGCNKPPPHSR